MDTPFPLEVTRQVTVFTPYDYGSGVQAVRQCQGHCTPPPSGALRNACRIMLIPVPCSGHRQVTANPSMCPASPTAAAILGAAREERHLTARKPARPEKRKVDSSILSPDHNLSSVKPLP